MNLWTSLRNNNLEAATSILSDISEIDVNAPDNTGQTPLCWTIKNNAIDMARLLLTKGAKEGITMTNCTDQPSVYWGTLCHHPELLRLFLDKVAKKSINAPDNQGLVPLYWAANRNNLEIARLLLDNGAKESINNTNVDGASALYWAAKRGNTEMARLLLDNGAWVTDMAFGTAEGDVKALLERHRLALSEVNTLLLSVQRKGVTLESNPDNALYDHSALLGGLIPALIFSHLRTPVANIENQDGANTGLKVQGQGPCNDKKPRHAL